MPGERERGDGKEGGRRLSGTAPRLYERAAEMLSERIRRGVLPPGSHLTESMVAEQFGISRPPARRALVEIERQGLIERKKGQGYSVLDVEGAGKAACPTDGCEENVPLLSLPSWERIYGEVEDEIIARISFGDWRINEAKLARHYRVSRTVARDVVGRLQQRGLLRKDETARWYAPALTHDHVRDLYELRAIIEPAALVKAAPHVPPSFIDAMRGNLEAAITDANAIAGTTLDRLEEEMHVALLGHCGNQVLMQAMTSPQSLLVAHRFLYHWTPDLFSREPFLLEHLEIVRRLQDGNPAAAAAALQRHLYIAGDRAIARVDLVRRELTAEALPYLDRLDR